MSMRRRCRETITARGGHTRYKRQYMSIFDRVLIMLVDSDIVKDTLFLFCYGYTKDTKEGKYTPFVFCHMHNFKKI